MTPSGNRNPTAFVSWAHDDDAWQDTIAAFVVALREYGIDADVDLFHTHDDAVDWSTYGPSAIEQNDFVLIATSATYKQRWQGVRTTRVGAGAAREANVLKALLDRDPAVFIKKVIIVVLCDARDADIPNELAAGLPSFAIPAIDERHLEDLLRRLTGQPAYVRPETGQVRILPPTIGGSVKPAEESADLATSERQVASELKQRIEQLDESIATTPDGSVRRDRQKAERSALSAALAVMTRRLQRDRWPTGLKRWGLVLAGIAVVLASVAVVAVDAGGPPAPVKIGALYPLTGPNADLGRDVYLGARLAVDYINGGHDPESMLALSAGAGLPRLDGAKLQLVKADSRSDRCKVTAVFDRLVDRDRVAAVVGAYESTSTLRAIVAADRRHVPLVNESSTAASLTSPPARSGGLLKTCGATERDPRPSPWFFRISPNDKQAAKLFHEFITYIERSSTVRVRRVAILHENNDIFGELGAAITKKQLGRRRGTTIREFSYHTVLGPSRSLSDSDCTVQEYELVRTLKVRARQIERYRPDVVFAIGYTPDAVTAVQAMQHFGYMPPALLAYGGGFLDSRFIGAVRAGNLACGLGRADPDGIVARTSWSPDGASQSQTARRIAQLFHARYNRLMPAQAAQGFTAVLTLAQAINNAGSTDPDKIRRALRALDVPAQATIMPWTGIKFDDRGDNVRSLFVLQQIIGGRYAVVYPRDVYTTRARWPIAKAHR
jgi:branched-chain amino acid transport system substrate-binding protein